ncbi:unnamed protein product [Clonostachys rosea]|uniref:Uncharacterized protein n=1 Tax=Bionectria ochroleuca TaxID=29856 RepID=A0ABY6TZ82_BIOOC|nr:unnamed protein product [Clonostachys rosea]
MSRPSSRHRNNAINSPEQIDPAHLPLDKLYYRFKEEFKEMDELEDLERAIHQLEADYKSCYQSSTAVDQVRPSLRRAAAWDEKYQRTGLLKPFKISLLILRKALLAAPDDIPDVSHSASGQDQWRSSTMSQHN